MKIKQLSYFQFREPKWCCIYSINEYWEYVKYAVTGETNKLVIFK